MTESFSDSVVDCLVRDDRWKEVLPGFESLCSDAIQTALKMGGQNPDKAVEIAVLFADDIFVQDLNARYRGKDRATNVLSFPAEAELPFSAVKSHPLPLGSVALAYETVLREAQDQGKSIPAHVRHLIVHGILHLLGYDHQTDSDAEQMEQLEIMILQSLGDPDPYQWQSEAAE